MPSLDGSRPITLEYPGELVGVALIGHDQHPVYGVPADSEPRDGDFNVPVDVDGQELTLVPPEHLPPGRWHVWVRSARGGEQITTRVGSFVLEGADGG